MSTSNRPACLLANAFGVGSSDWLGGIMVSYSIEHDLACHASLPEQLVRVSCLGKRKSLRDERLDLLLLKEVEQGDQILSKQCRSQPFEPLDAVRDHPPPTREKPAAGNIQPENGDSMKAMTTT